MSAEGWVTVTSADRLLLHYSVLSTQHSALSFTLRVLARLLPGRHGPGHCSVVASDARFAAAARPSAGSAVRDLPHRSRPNSPVVARERRWPSDAGRPHAALRPREWASLACVS